MFLKQCPIVPNGYEIVMNEAFLLLKTDLDTLMVQAVKYDSLGKSELAKAAFNKLNNYHYLVEYFTLMKYKLSQDPDQDFDDFIEEHKIDCIRKKMACVGIDIDPLLELFGFTSTGGISVMRIGPNPNPVPFTIHP